MTLTLGEIFANPDHYLFAFEGEFALFREMDRWAYHRSIFLDRRIDAASSRVLKVPIDPLLAHQIGQPVREIGWIFHIAHCGSTLLARGLDRIDDSLVLREPVPLRQLAVEGGTPSAAWRDGLRLVTAMLGRRYREDVPTIVKANVPVNFILPELIAVDPGAKAILLHFSLDHYLAAILRTPAHRAWLAAVTDEMRLAIEAEVGSTAGLDDAGRAAALWLAQMRIYARAMEDAPQFRSLDAEQLFNAPGATLAAASAYFGLAAQDDAPIAALTATYAKNPDAAFDNTARLERRESMRSSLAAELDEAQAWVRGRLPACPLPDRLPRPLAG